MLTERLEALVSDIGGEVGLRLAHRDMLAHRWEAAVRKLSQIRSSLVERGRSERLPRIHEALFLAAIHTGDRQSIREVARTIRDAPRVQRPDTLASLSVVRRLARALSDEGTLVLASVAQATTTLYPGVGGTYVAARILERCVLVDKVTTLGRRQRLQLYAEADELFSAVQATLSGSSADAVAMRRASLAARLRSLGATAPPPDRWLRRVKPFRLPTSLQLSYAFLMLRSKRPMTRVRALDILLGVALDSRHRPTALALVQRALALAGEDTGALEQDRLEDAIERFFAPSEQAEALAHLQRVSSCQKARDSGDRRELLGLEPTKFLQELQARLDGAPPETSPAPLDARAASLRALDLCHGDAELSRELADFYTHSDRRRGDFRPLAAALPMCLARWAQLASSHAALRELFKAYLVRGPRPPYGFAQLAGVLSSQGEAKLAGLAAARAFIRNPRPSLEPLICAGARADIERGALRAARDIFANLRQPPGA